MKIITFAMSSLDWYGIPRGELIDRLLAKLDSCEAEKPDLICLTEKVLDTTGASREPDRDRTTETFLAVLSERAARMGTYIVCGLTEPIPEHPGRHYNTAYLIDRQGKIAGKYRKRHVTVRELAEGDVPSDELPVFDTAFGKWGILTCFDSTCREDWAELGRRGADLVIWLAAYDGGALIPGYAAVHGYAVVTSVWTDRARVIDRLGHTIADSRGGDGMLIARLDEDAVIYHTDFQETRIEEIPARLGNRVSLRHYPDEDVFTLSSHDPSLPISEIEKTFSLVRYRDYASDTDRRCEEAKREFREEREGGPECKP